MKPPIIKPKTERQKRRLADAPVRPDMGIPISPNRACALLILRISRMLWDLHFDPRANLTAWDRGDLLFFRQRLVIMARATKEKQPDVKSGRLAAKMKRQRLRGQSLVVE